MSSYNIPQMRSMTTHASRISALVFAIVVSSAILLFTALLQQWSEPVVTSSNHGAIYGVFSPIRKGNNSFDAIDETIEKAVDASLHHAKVDKGIPKEAVDASLHHTNVDKAIPKDVQDEDWPPLDDLIGDNITNITGDVQFLLDFAIIAHPKTASTFTMHWLADHNEVAMYKYELHSLREGKPAELVSQLYDLPQGSYYKRGYKNPGDIRSERSLRALHKHWGQTRLIVGLRHPVLWFESFYNFRSRKYTMPPPEKLIGKEKNGMHSVSTDEAKFHLHLDNLGKTDRSTEESKLLSWGNTNRPKKRKMKNPVFLFDIKQLTDTNTTQADKYRSDLKEFLGLKTDLKPIDPSHESKNKEYAINICDHKHNTVRAELMKNAVEASMWIRTYFLASPDVTVSSPEYFNELMESWMVDPCVNRQDKGNH